MTYFINYFINPCIRHFVRNRQLNFFKDFINVIVASLLFLTAFASSANADVKQSEESFDDSGFHWELDFGLLAFYRETLVKSIADYDREVSLSGVVSGGVYFDNFFAELAPLSGRPLTFGYTLYKKETRQLNIIAESLFYDISEDDQENGHLLDGINDRESSMEVGVEYFGIYKKYDFRVKLLHDGLGKHKGAIGSAELSRPIFTRHVMFVPGIAITYISENATDYYYGVSKEEATASRAIYQPNGAWIATARLYLERPMSDDWSFIASASYSLVSNEILDSPIINHSVEPYSVGIGVLWTF